MSKSWPFKDPEEVLDYGFDWSPRDLGDDTITASTATVKSGDIVVDSHNVSAYPGVPAGQFTKTWLSGGTASDEPCVINLHAVTAGGRELEQDVKIKIKERA